MYGPASPQTAFDIYRKIQSTHTGFSLSNAFIELTNLAISSISAGEHMQAVSILKQLKECFEQSRGILDGQPERLINHTMTIKVLQHENCQLRLELARASGDEEAIAMCKEELNQFGLYVASAIVDLAG